MTKIVVDTNIIFSLLLNKNRKMRDIFFNTEDLSFYSCKYVIIELFKNKEKIKRYSMLDDEEIIELLYIILRDINIYDEFLLTNKSLLKAVELCKNIDEKDIPFVALTIELKGLLWTGDKKLKEGLKAKAFSSFFEIENKTSNN